MDPHPVGPKTYGSTAPFCMLIYTKHPFFLLSKDPDLLKKRATFLFSRILNFLTFRIQVH